MDGSTVGALVKVKITSIFVLFLTESSDLNASIFFMKILINI